MPGREVLAVAVWRVIPVSAAVRHGRVLPPHLSVLRSATFPSSLIDISSPSMAPRYNETLIHADSSASAPG